MSERFVATIETAEERKAACAAMGSRAVGNCIGCPAAVSCPILQLKQLSQEMVTASPKDTESSIGGDIYNDGGCDGNYSLKNMTATTQIKPLQQGVHAQEKQIMKKRTAEQAMYERLRQQSHVPQQQPGKEVQRKTFLELLMDGVTELVLAGSTHQK